jgi:hypothetical protein
MGCGLQTQARRDRHQALSVVNADVGGPAPFPRDGGKEILDDDRVTAWDYLTESDVKAGTMHHLPAGSDETVETVSGSPRAILFQLK